MKITFHGAARTVTGSQHLLEINGKRLLLDCGLFQGRRQETYERNRKLPYDPRRVDAVILSHAHTDHVGNLPNLVKNGFDGPIYTTPATAHLGNIMVMDSAHIQEADARHLNRHPKVEMQPLIEPIYTMEDAARVAQHFWSVPYEETFEVLPGVQATLYDAGHILGSAGVALDIEEKHKKFRVWFSGDIGRRSLPLLKDPVLPDRADYLIMECTYGDKAHRDPQMAHDELREVVNKTVRRGGKVIIPAFAIGRTQDIVYALHKYMDRKEIPAIPVIVDSPLATNVSEIYTAHPECFDEETQQFIHSDSHREALGFKNLTYTRSVEDSKALNERKDPMVIISASGMAETGRILHHLKNNIEDPKNTILIVSWQAPYTLGRRLADREERVKIFGEVYERKAEVSTIGGLSAHGGQAMLLEYATGIKESVKQIFLVHGEATPAEALMGKMREAGMEKVSYPELHEGVEV
jgi:metallo-beta-lactamase family protein